MPSNETAGLAGLARRAAQLGDASAGEILTAALPATQQRLVEGLELLAGGLDQLRRVSQTQVEATSENTQALQLSTQSHGSGGWAKAGEVARGALGGLGLGMSLSPLLSGILGLFRGKKTAVPAPPTTYLRPAPLQFEGAAPQEPGGPFLATDYGVDGLSRVVPTERSTNVTVQVQAMDSRSFLDHRDEIARAVKEAMLNSHALNDVVGEL